MDEEKGYIKYVKDVIEKFSKDSNLIYQDQVHPQELNRALALYVPTNLAIIAEYQRAKVNKFDLENAFNKWYDLKFVETRKRLFSENATNAKVSLKEIEIDLKYNQAVEYYDWQKKLNEADAKVSFLRRLVEIYKNFDSILTTISNNTRQEMRSLNIENRMNTDPTKNKVRSEFPKRGE